MIYNWWGLPCQVWAKQLGTIYIDPVGTSLVIRYTNYGMVYGVYPHHPPSQVFRTQTTYLLAGCKRSLFMAQEKATFCYISVAVLPQISQVSIESLDRKLHKPGVYPMYPMYCIQHVIIPSI